MRLLLDTHIVLWFITGDDWLSQYFRSSIENADGPTVTVKYQLGNSESITASNHCL